MIKKIVLLFAFCVISINEVYAGDNAGAFLKIGIGARPSGMGNAFIAISDDATSTFWNPAGIARLKASEISLTNIRLNEDRDYSSLSYVYPMKTISLGFTYITSVMSGILIYDESDNFLGITSDKQQCYIFSFSTKAGRNIYVGSNLKYLTQKAYTNTANGVGFDLGFLYPLNRLSFGLGLRDIGFTVKWNTETNHKDTVPRKIILGMAYKIPIKSNHISFSLDMEDIKGEGTKTHLGSEYYPFSQLALRAGVDDKKFSVGVGIFVNNFKVDYAFNTKEIGDFHRISVGFVFQKEKEPGNIKSESQNNEKTVKETPLEIALLSPQEGAILKDSPVEIKGQITSLGNVEVSVNNETAEIKKDVGENYVFSMLVALESNNAKVNIVAKNDRGEQKEKEITLIYDKEAPEIFIESPSEPQTDKENIILMGRIIDDTGIKTFSINGETYSLSDEQEHRFEKGIKMVEGENIIKVSAIDQAGRLKEKELVVRYIPAQVKEKEKAIEKEKVLTGKLMSISPEFLAFGLTQKDGMKKGQILYIKRNGETIGRIKVITLSAQFTGGEIIELKEGIEVDSSDLIVNVP